MGKQILKPVAPDVVLAGYYRRATPGTAPPIARWGGVNALDSLQPGLAYLTRRRMRRLYALSTTTETLRGSPRGTVLSR